MSRAQLWPSCVSCSWLIRWKRGLDMVGSGVVGRANAWPRFTEALDRVTKSRQDRGQESG
eukprot:scaffold72242_cov60-Phaeocystis_antarctica.AAC.2